MQFSDLQEGDVVLMNYYDTPEEPMRLYTWLRKRENYYFAATDLWAEFGDRYIDSDWQFAENDNYEIVDVVFNVPQPDPLKMLQDLHPELFI